MENLIPRDTNWILQILPHPPTATSSAACSSEQHLSPGNKTRSFLNVVQQYLCPGAHSTPGWFVHYNDEQLVPAESAWDVLSLKSCLSAPFPDLNLSWLLNLQVELQIRGEVLLAQLFTNRGPKAIGRLLLGYSSKVKEKSPLHLKIAKAEARSIMSSLCLITFLILSVYSSPPTTEHIIADLEDLGRTGYH